jgi:Flp pilus assembly protein TadB
MKNFRTPPTASGPMPKRTHSRKALLGVSAMTYLALCVWLGPKVATSLIIVAALLAAWFWTCRRHPTAAWLTWAFMRGLAGR